MKTKKVRPDYQFVCPYVEHKTDDLIILIPETLVQKQSLRLCGKEKRRFSI